jgi:hypothetical protein
MADSSTPKKAFVFGKENFKLFFIGVALVVLGFILMIGGGSDDPSQFDADALFSHSRITLAPALVIAGYVVVIFSIMKSPKSKATKE